MMYLLRILLFASFGLLVLVTNIQAQTVSDTRVQHIESRLDHLSSQVRNSADSGLVLILFGAFCALWAQNTNRNPWLWFFMGFIFSVITVIVLLIKNAKDGHASVV